ncbi:MULTISPECIES: hypothetical protein [unclassified Variovorax]|uniref:hypothetical protein n=1 Tax=unclassified Variovorax TaxID=663243 RepID=UPI003F448376
MSGNRTGFDEDGDLRDPALRRALDHAPDRDAAPHPRTRDAILKMAHNLAAAPVSATGAAANSARAAPWWRRLFGGDGAPRSRMPWNAAFATVLVAAFVTVMWRSEPVPDARLDGEARVGGAAAPAAKAPAVPVAPVTPEPVPPPPVEAQQAPAAPAQAAPAAEQRADVLRDSSSAKETARAQPARKQAAPAPVVPAPVAPSAPPPVVAEPSVSAPAQDERREERVESERRRAFAPPAPAASVAPPPAIAAAPLSRPSQDASALARGGADADATGALRDAAPRAAAKAAPSRAAAPPFAALERWTSLSFTRSGAEVRRERGDVEGLPALVGAVARSATAPGASMDAPVEARLALYRGDALIAVLEIAGDQVRWTPQPGGAARVGTPPAQALDALRSVLTR